MTLTENTEGTPARIANYRSQGDLFKGDYNSRRDKVKAQRMKSKDSSVSSSNDEHLNSLVEQINDVCGDINAKLSSFHPNVKRKSKNKSMCRSFTMNANIPTKSKYAKYMENKGGEAKGKHLASLILVPNNILNK